MRERSEDEGEKRGRGKLRESGASPSHEMQEWPDCKPGKRGRPAVSSRDVTQVPIGEAEGAGGQCS